MTIFKSAGVVAALALLGAGCERAAPVTDAGAAPAQTLYDQGMGCIASIAKASLEKAGLQQTGVYSDATAENLQALFETTDKKWTAVLLAEGAKAGLASDQVNKQMAATAEGALDDVNQFMQSHPANAAIASRFTGDLNSSLACLKRVSDLGSTETQAASSTADPAASADASNAPPPSDAAPADQPAAN